LLDVKLADIVNHFASAMAEVFRHLGFTEMECQVGCEMAA